jgi:hypothetical protein
MVCCASVLTLLTRVTDDGACCLPNQENCDGTIAVDVSVKSNKFTDDKMVQVVR